MYAKHVSVAQGLVPGCGAWRPHHSALPHTCAVGSLPCTQHPGQGGECGGMVGRGGRKEQGGSCRAQAGRGGCLLVETQSRDLGVRPTHQGDVAERAELPEALAALPEPHAGAVGAWGEGNSEPGTSPPPPCPPPGRQALPTQDAHRWPRGLCSAGRPLTTPRRAAPGPAPPAARGPPAAGQAAVSWRDPTRPGSWGRRQ